MIKSIKSMQEKTAASRKAIVIPKTFLTVLCVEMLKELACEGQNVSLVNVIST